MTGIAKQGTLRDLEKQGIRVGYSIVVSGAYPPTFYDDRGVRTWTHDIDRAWACSSKDDAEECRRRVAYLTGLPLHVSTMHTSVREREAFLMSVNFQDDDKAAPFRHQAMSDRWG